MANVLRLATADYTYAAGRVDLRSGIYRLKRGGWQPKVTTAQPPPVTPIVETIDLIAEEPAAQLAIGERLINGALEEAREWFTDPLRFSSRWLEWHTEGEAEATGGYPGKRALIYDGQLALDMPSGFDGAFVNGAAYGRLTLLRHPLWENTRYYLWTPASYPTVWTGSLALDLDYVPIGTAPSRLGRLQIGGYSGGPIYRWWFGIRPLYWGTSDFQHVWELEDGTAGTDTSSVVDATASAGDAMECTFSTTATMAKRVGITVGDVCTSNPEHQKGRYLILLRCKLTAGSTVVGIQLKWGGVDSDILNVCEEVYFQDTNWRLIELGEIQIPSYLDKLGLYADTESGGGIDWSDFEIQIHGERLSGSGYLRLDALKFIPSGHMVTIDKSATAMATEVGRTTAIHTLEDDRIFVSVRESNVPAADIEWSARDWYIPRDAGILVLAGERETQHVMTDSVSLGLYTYARWHLFRSA